MNRILTVIAASLLCAASSRAQYIVYDRRCTRKPSLMKPRTLPST